MNEIALDKWSDIHRLDARRWIWRGHREAGWDVQSSLERLFDRRAIEHERKAYIEAELLREFRRTFHHWGGRIPSDDLKVEWASIMQHYGAPTRMVDFSYSIYVAAYFALEKAEHDCAIIGIDSEWAAKAASRLVTAKEPELAQNLLGNTTETLEQAVSRAAYEGTFIRCVFPANPFRMNERLRIQKGIFLIPGDPTVDFMENLAAMEGWESHVKKVVIPKAFRNEALESLFYMNISRTSLFPGLDGYAQSLGIFHPSFNPESQFNGKRQNH